MGKTQHPQGTSIEERNAPLNLDQWKAEIKAVSWSGLIPFRNFITDRPWTLLWVQFITFTFGFPFLLMGYYRKEHSTLAEAAWAFGVYFAVVSAALIRQCIRPDKLVLSRIIGTWVDTSVLGVFTVLFVSFLGGITPGVRDLFVASESANTLGRLIGMTLAVGLVEETSKLLSVLWFASKIGGTPRPTTIAFLGVISGLSFGATEAIVDSIRYAAGHASLQIAALSVIPLTRQRDSEQALQQGLEFLLHLTSRHTT